MNAERQTKIRNPKVRTSVSLSEEAYREVERIAEQKKVSVAWVVREAVEQYLNGLQPLFRSEE